MYSLYATDRALDTIMIGTSNPNWRAVLQRQKYIIVDKDDTAVLQEVAEDGSLYNILSQDYDITIKGDPLLFKKIRNDNKQIQNYPLSFFLGIFPQKEAEYIQNHYGVICLSDDIIDDNNAIFCLNSNKRVVEGEGKPKISWNKLLSKVSKIPSSGLIIIDRNLFTNGGNWNETHNRLSLHGINNIRDILIELLPETFDGFYQVLIITDERTLDDKNYNLDDVCQQLTRIYMNHKLRSYDISFEIVSFKDKDAMHYKESHNRRVISNYFMMAPEHKVSVFDFKNKATITEYFPIKSAFGEGLDDDSDCPEDEIDYTLSWIKDIDNSNENGKSHFSYSKDGQSLSDFKQLENRLVKNFHKNEE